MLEVIQIFLNHVQQEGELGLPEVGDAGDPEVFQVGVFFQFIIIIIVIKCAHPSRTHSD